MNNDLDAEINFKIYIKYFFVSNQSATISLIRFIKELSKNKSGLFNKL